MLAHPQHLSDKTQYAIDQYVLGGGKALVFVDPNSETQQMHPSQLNPPGMPLGSDMPRLFKAWGLSMDPERGGGRPARGASRQCRHAAARRGDGLRRLAVARPAGPQSRQPDHGRSDAYQLGVGGHPAAGEGREDNLHAADHHLDRFDADRCREDQRRQRRARCRRLAARLQAERREAGAGGASDGHGRDRFPRWSAEGREERRQSGGR